MVAVPVPVPVPVPVAILVAIVVGTAVSGVAAAETAPHSGFYGNERGGMAGLQYPFFNMKGWGSRVQSTSFCSFISK